MRRWQAVMGLGVAFALGMISLFPPPPRVAIAVDPTLDAALRAIAQATVNAQATREARDAQAAAQRATDAALVIQQRQAALTATAQAASVSATDAAIRFEQTRAAMTATAEARRFATAQTYATATALARADATATARAQATQQAQATAHADATTTAQAARTATARAEATATRRAELQAESDQQIRVATANALGAVGIIAGVVLAALVILSAWRRIKKPVVIVEDVQGAPAEFTPPATPEDAATEAPPTRILASNRIAVELGKLFEENGNDDSAGSTS